MDQPAVDPDPHGARAAKAQDGGLGARRLHLDEYVSGGVSIRPQQTIECEGTAHARNRDGAPGDFALLAGKDTTGRRPTLGKLRRMDLAEAPPSRRIERSDHGEVVGQPIGAPVCRTRHAPTEKAERPPATFRLRAVPARQRLLRQQLFGLRCYQRIRDGVSSERRERSRDGARRVITRQLGELRQRRHGRGLPASRLESIDRFPQPSLGRRCRRNGRSARSRRNGRGSRSHRARPADGCGDEETDGNVTAGLKAQVRPK